MRLSCYNNCAPSRTKTPTEFSVGVFAVYYLGCLGARLPSLLAPMKRVKLIAGDGQGQGGLLGCGQVGKGLSVLGILAHNY